MEVELSRDRIIDAAFAVFQDRGLRHGTLFEVARRAGISRATLYRYFPGKEALLRAVVLREARKLFALLDDTLGPDESDPAAMLERGLVVSLGYLRAHPLLQRVLHSEPETILPELTIRAEPILEAAVEFAAPYIERAVKEGRVRRADPRMAAEWAARILLSLVLTPSVTADLDDPIQLRAFVSWLVEPGGTE